MGLQDYRFGGLAENGVGVVVSASADEARQAVLTWAKQTGWFLTPAPAPGMVFAFSRASYLFTGPELAVYVVGRDDGSTGIQFTASMQTTTPGLFDDLQRMAENFAMGVCLQLKARGATISPPYLGSSSRDPRKIGAIFRWLRWTTLTLLGLAAPAAALAAVFVSKSVFAGTLAMAWLLVLAVIPEFIRSRLLGVKYNVVLAFLILCCLSLAVSTTILVLVLLGLL